MTTLLQKTRRTAGLVLLLVMSLGSACHFWHHLSDPSCEVVGKRGAQPCATCSALHGSVLAAKACLTTRPHAITVSPAYLAESDDPHAPILVGGAPRGPPIA
jgi:hypothetical protein